MFEVGDKVNVCIVVAAVLYNKNGQVLIAQRPQGKSFPGLWEFPGGKLESGERPEAGLIRELHEELGIIVKEKDLVPLTFASYGYKDFHLLMPLFGCYKWDGTIKKCEHDDIVWSYPQDLRSYEMPEADIALVDFLINQKRPN